MAGRADDDEPRRLGKFALPDTGGLSATASVGQQASLHDGSSQIAKPLRVTQGWRTGNTEESSYGRR